MLRYGALCCAVIHCTHTFSAKCVSHVGMFLIGNNADFAIRNTVYNAIDPTSIIMEIDTTISSQ